MGDGREHVWITETDPVTGKTEHRCSVCGPNPCPVHEPMTAARWMAKQLAAVADPPRPASPSSDTEAGR
jgi:hypothetical protein